MTNESTGQRSQSHVKRASTYYTAEKIQNARNNIARYDWARKIKDEAVARAEYFLQFGLNRLWESITHQSLPRSLWVNKDKGSPITGKVFIKMYGLTGWKADPLNRPWKLTDPSSGYVFPTNDFKAYYESGLDVNRVFRRERADPRYLVNELYPEKGANWGVDDGFGWIDEEGAKWGFAAYYNYFYSWGGGKGAAVGGTTAFRDAFLYTGDLRYAQAGIILLDRVAELYQELDCSVYKWEDGYYQSHGLTGKGNVAGSISDCDIASELAAAYDAFFPAVGEAGVVEFLRKKAARYGGSNAKDTAGAICKNIEDGLIREIFPAVKEAKIRGNFGMHQRAVAMAAVVLDDPETTEEWIDWIYRTGGMVYDPELRLTGGNLMATLVDDVDRDGFSNEASPGYNILWLKHLKPVADLLESALYANVKFKKMFDSRYPLTMINQYTALIGDVEKTGNPYLPGSVEEAVTSFVKFGDPVFAQYAYLLNGNKLDGMESEIFAPDPERTIEAIREVIGRCGPLQLESVHLTGYGFTALRQGHAFGDTSAGNLRGLWMYYGRNFGHGHRDTLNIGLHAFELDLLPDNGTPETKDLDPRRLEWFSNTIAHNTVVVNKSKQDKQWVGIPHHFEGDGRFQFFDVEAPKAYPVTSLYRRTTAYIQIDDVHSYAVDFFRVKGGNDHRYSFHAAEGEAVVEGLSLVRQEKGTYAGEDVEFGTRDAEEIRAYSSPDNYNGSGFQYLLNVERGRPQAEAFGVDWAIKDTWRARMQSDGDVHVRVTMLGDFDEVALADGLPPQVPGNPDKLKYLLAARSGPALESQFLAVIEPYKGQRCLRSIERASLKINGAPYTGTDAAAIKVVTFEGRTDYIVNSIRDDILFTVDDRLKFQGCFAVYSECDGEPLYAYINDGVILENEKGPLLQLHAGHLEGTVADFTKELALENEITVEMETTGVELLSLKGKYIYIQNDGERNAAYKIKSIEPLGGLRYRIRIGDATLIRRYKNPRRFEEGFIFDIAVGDRFTIPLSAYAAPQRIC